MTGSPFEHFNLPPVWPQSLLQDIRARNAAAFTPIVVLDDDPLGGQCVHDIPVLTEWETRLLAKESEQSDAFLLLTNTRSLERDAAIKRAEEVGFFLTQAIYKSAVMMTPIWRSDSTLRGHFWHEMTAFTREFPGDGAPEPVFVFIPYFGKAGRYTLDDTQYVLQDGSLVPVADSEFACDPLHAFEHSHLPTWIEAHTHGDILASEVVSIGIDDLRVGGPGRVAEVLAEVPGGFAVVVNAVDDRDLEVFVAGMQQAEAAGGYFLCTGAAPFVRARLGQPKHPLLTPEDLGLSLASQHAGKLHPGAGGLTICGSYVDKSTAQLEHALADSTLRSLELSLNTLDHTRIAAQIAKHVAAGEDVVLHTSRQYVDGAAPRITEALASVIGALDVRPRYLMVKGGSTASALATGVLGVQRAMVLGQLLPGVPVWRLGEESRWPGLPFVIFAGNVGGTESLAEALRILRGS